MGIRKYIIYSIYIFLLVCAVGCTQNKLFLYLDNAEVQFEDSQRENLLLALNDALTLSEENLKAKRYYEYSGKKKIWDIKTIFVKYFVPDGSKDIGDNFYEDLKKNKVQEQIREIINKIK